MDKQKSLSALPGEKLAADKMPGHWLLAQMGKRVLRPGGIQLTHQMLTALDIQSTDHVVEFAPGLGITARLVLANQPASYTGIEQNESAAARVRQVLPTSAATCQVGRAEESGLPDATATVLYGEAMLTMQSPTIKQRIVAEAARILQPGGRYGIHELCLIPDDIAGSQKEALHRALSNAIHVGARPLTIAEWKALLAEAGFRIAVEKTAPMHLLEPKRLFQDEGVLGGLRFSWNVLRNKAARKRVSAMRTIFRQYQPHLAAVTLVGIKQ